MFHKSPDRLLDADLAAKLFVAVLNLPEMRKSLSSEHFSVDGTLIEAWASVKSFAQKKDSPTRKDNSGSRTWDIGRAFHGEKRKNDTHSSTIDSGARLFRKGAGKQSKLCHLAHLIENRNGLTINAGVTEANGMPERRTALDMVEDNTKPGSTVGAGRNDDTDNFVGRCWEHACTLHVSQNNTNRLSAIDGRTTRRFGYRICTIKHTRINQAFGWIKILSSLRETRDRRRMQDEWFFVLTETAYNGRCDYLRQIQRNMSGVTLTVSKVSDRAAP